MKRTPLTRKTPLKATTIKASGKRKAGCGCESCRPVTLSDMRMVVCAICGNKRCPHATDHRNACTNSNEIGQAGSSWADVKPIRPRMKSSRPKMTPARKAAKGCDCTVQFPGCPNARETTVLAHLRMYGGGGMGIKPHDSEAVFADAYCHDRMDGRVPMWLGEGESRHEYIARALIRTLRIQREKGVLIYKGE